MPSKFRCNYNRMANTLGLERDAVTIVQPGAPILGDYMAVKKIAQRFRRRLYQLREKRIGRFCVALKNGNDIGPVYIHKEDYPKIIDYLEKKGAPPVIEPPVQTPIFGHEQILQELAPLKDIQQRLARIEKMLDIIKKGNGDGRQIG